ncbi:MAG: TonB-dependent receptor [Prolixibacteraceae bacterium]|nr:TonB-dependent receptor [Prolixibacteraceae bacterium]
MKKHREWDSHVWLLKKLLRIMKLTSILILALVLNVTASSYSQNAKLNIHVKNGTFVDVLKQIENQSEFYFYYNNDEISSIKDVSISADNQKIQEVLDGLLSGTNLEYKIIDRYIALKKKEMNEFDRELGMQQQKSVSGKVTDSTGAPLPGASVAVKGTTNGTITDMDGSYTIKNISAEATLVFSFVGMKSQEVISSGKSTINVQLEDETVGIEEVVAIAYGTAKKKDLTGSISTVDSKLMTTQANSTVTRALEGAIAGLQVSAVDGQPGLDMGIRLRGIGSANQNTSNALVVIDGVPAQNDNPLSTINSKDIESVTILKDAASTALYGSRGANGVVLVTTKKGAKGETKVSFEGRWGINQVGPYQFDKISDPKDVYEYAWQAIYNSVRYGVNGSGMAKNYTTNVQNPNMTNEAAAQFASAHLFNYTGSNTSFTRNALGNWMSYNVPGAVYTTTGSGSTASATMSDAYLVNTDGKLNPNAKLLYNDNYDKYLLENKLRQEYNISATGGNEKVDYFFSLGYLEDPSYIRGSEFSRYNGRTSINAKLFDWLKMGTNIAYSYRETQSPATRFGRNAGSAVANVFRFINGQNQLIQLYAHDKDGNYIYNADGSKKVHVLAGDTYSPLGLTSTSLSSTNILTMLDTDQDIKKSSDVITRSYAEVKLMKDLILITNLGLEKYHETRTRYWQSTTGQAQGTGAFGKTFQNVTVLNTQQLLSYSRDIDKHHVDALVGHEFNKYKLENINYNSAYELIPGFVSYSNFVGRYTGGTFATPGGSETSNAMESYLGRANYIFDGKYYASASLRRDGSSKFKQKENRWGTFWSIGGGWRTSAESFMENTKSWLDNLKVRASYGVIGNQSGIGNYSGYQTWSYGATYTSTTNGTGIPASFTLAKGGYVNEYLTWENTKTFDAGLEFSLLNRISGTFDFFNKNTTNAVWDQPIALSLGQSSLQRNSARIQNSGFEIELNVDIINKKDLLWAVSLNGTHYTTVLKAAPTVGSAALNGGWTATADAWSASGGGASSGITYLRGVDKDYYNLYLFKYAGVDQTTGLPLFYHQVTETDHTKGLYTDVAVGGDAKTTNYSTASRYEMGSAIPDWIGGFSTTLRYKNFDFTGQLAYQLGGKYFSTEYGNGLYNNSNIGGAMSAELIGNTWTPENTDAKFPMAMYGNTYGDGSTFGSWMYTDLALFSASYLNIKNLTLGFTLPKSTLKKYKISNLRVYVSGDNLWMVTSHSGIDPRMSLVGGLEVGAYSYPSMRTISFGVNLDL